MKEFEQLEKSIQDQLLEMRKIYQQVLEENEKLKGRSNSSVDASNFGINVDDDASPTASRRVSRGIPSATTSASNASDTTIKPSDKFNTTDLTELLETDPLSNSVYNRLKPLGSVKQRVLAMQMGISNEKCQTAIDRLSAAGGVKLEDGDMVTALSP